MTPSNLGEARLYGVEVAQAAIDRDRQAGQPLLQPRGPAVIEGRHVAVLLGREPLEPGLAGMDDQPIHARGHQGVGQGRRGHLGILIVDADPAFHRHRHGDRGLHGGDARGDQGRSRIRQAPKRPSCTRSDGQPTLRFTSS